MKLPSGKKDSKTDEVQISAQESPRNPQMLALYEEFTEDLPDDVEQCYTRIGRQFSVVLQQTTCRYWYIGKIIAHLENLGEKDILEKISVDLNVKKRTVQYIKAVYSKIPDFTQLLYAVQAGLTWSDVKDICAIEDAEREVLLAQIGDGSLTRDDVQNLLKESNEPSGGEGSGDPLPVDMSFEDDPGGSDEEPDIEQETFEVFRSFAAMLEKTWDTVEEKTDSLQQALDRASDVDMISEEAYEKIRTAIEDACRFSGFLQNSLRNTSSLLNAFLKEDEA